MPTKKTTEKYKKDVYNLVKDEYSVLGNYEHSTIKIKMKHNICGTEYEIEPTGFMNGTRCPHCFGKFKKSTEQFKKEVYDLYGDEYSVLGEYINNRTKILIRHNNCGREYEVYPYDFVHGLYQCKSCSRNQDEENKKFKERIYEIVGNEYSILGDYLNMNTNIKTRHEVCGYEWNMRPNSFVYARTRCPKCSNSIKDKTTEYFQNELNEKYGNVYLLLSEYKGNNTNIKIKHNIESCGHEWIAYPSNLLTDCKSIEKCPVCQKKPKGDLRRKTQDKFKMEVYNSVKEEYLVIGEYINYHTPIKMMHNLTECNHLFEMTPSAFLSKGCRCPRCNIENRRKTQEQFAKEVFNLVGDEYTVIGEYIASDQYIHMRHNICGHEYQVKPNSFLSGNRCPTCKVNGASKIPHDEFVKGFRV